MFVPHAAFAQGPCMTLEGTCRTRGHFVARVAMLQTFACSDKYVQILLQYDFQLWVCCILYSYEFSRHINDKRLGAKSRAEMLRQQILRGSQDDFRRKVLTIWSICQMQSFVLCISSLCWSLAQCFSVQEGMQHFQSNMHGVRMTLFSVEPVLSSSAVHQVCIGLLLTVFRCSEISCLCCSRKATQIWTTFNQRGSKVPGSFVLQNRSRRSLCVASCQTDRLFWGRPRQPAQSFPQNGLHVGVSIDTWRIKHVFLEVILNTNKY